MSNRLVSTIPGRVWEGFYDPAYQPVTHMLPLGHLSVAYLCYVGYAAVQSRRLPSRWALLSVALGSQFPDVIDKPLAYWALIPSGRSLAHSVFSFVIISLIMWRVAQSLHGRWPADTWQDRLRVTTPSAFTIGYASHLLGDSYTFLLTGDLWPARFLLYPIYVVSYPVDTAVPPWIRLLTIYRNMDMHPQLYLLLVAVVLFIGIRLWAWRKRVHASPEKS